MKNLKEYICDKCLKKWKRGSWFHNLDDIKNFVSEKHNQGKEDYFLCISCHNIYEVEKFKNKIINLRKTKCSLCQKILLKDDETATLYYSIIEPDPNDKGGDQTIETPICLECWEKNKAKYYLDKYWAETIVNPDRIMGFAFGKDKITDLKLQPFTQITK